MNHTSMQICQEFLSVLGRFKASMQALAEEDGLTMVQAQALYVLSQRGSIPMGRVASELHCDASNVTGIIDRLVAQNLVARSEDPNDRRTKRLVLTANGKSVIDKFFRRLPRELGFTSLDASERTALFHMLQKLKP